MLFDPEAPKFFVAEMRKLSQKDNGLDRDVTLRGWMATGPSKNDLAGAGTFSLVCYLCQLLFVRLAFQEKREGKLLPLFWEQ